MGDIFKLEVDSAPQIYPQKCGIRTIANSGYRQPPPPYYPPQTHGYYDQNSNFYQTQPSAFHHQTVGGQNVYVSGGGYPTQPPDVSRRQPAYVVNYPGNYEESNYRDSRIFTSAFDSVAIRNKFVQRVYSILSIQLFISFGFILLVTFIDQLRAVFRTHFFPITIASMIVYLGSAIPLLCCGDLRRRFPINFILLGLMVHYFLHKVAFTVPIVVLAAAGTTAVLCFLISIFACQTSWDVTGCGMCLCITMIVLMLYGVVIVILNAVGIVIPILHIIYSALGILLFSFWLMYDTQQIVGGRRFELSPEEYIVGALCLYIDIMYIFVHLLTLYNYCLRGGSQ